MFWVSNFQDTFPLSDSWNNFEEQHSLFWHGDGFRAVTQREGKIGWLHITSKYQNFKYCATVVFFLAVIVVMLQTQSFGIAEGRPKDDLKNMANAAGQSCRDYTPPGGETSEQVSHTQSGLLNRLHSWQAALSPHTNRRARTHTHKHTHTHTHAEPENQILTKYWSWVYSSILTRH